LSFSRRSVLMRNIIFRDVPLCCAVA
jgi:hypothetical protein